MSLPMKAIDRLFERLAATYGAQWVRQWADVPMTDVKTAWGHELSGFASNLQALAWALENLPERCPNVIEFRNICRAAPKPPAPQLPEPVADPKRLAGELAKLGEILSRPIERIDGRDWARSILARHESGERLNVTVLRFAKEAMRSSHA